MPEGPEIRRAADALHDHLAGRRLAAAQRTRLAGQMLAVTRRSYRTGGVTNRDDWVAVDRRAGRSRRRWRFAAFEREGSLRDADRATPRGRSAAVSLSVLSAGLTGVPVAQFIPLSCLGTHPTTKASAPRAAESPASAL